MYIGTVDIDQPLVVPLSTDPVYTQTQHEVPSDEA